LQKKTTSCTFKKSHWVAFAPQQALRYGVDVLYSQKPDS